jgi:hypothetical protein
MAKAYKRLRRERTERRLKNQSFMEPSKRPLSGKRKKSLETECSPQFFEPVSAISPEPGGTPMRPSAGRCVLGLTASVVIAALSPAMAQEQSHAAKERERSLISTVLTGK